jgi:hypothetical protein
LATIRARLTVLTPMRTSSRRAATTNSLNCSTEG